MYSKTMVIIFKEHKNGNCLFIFFYLIFLFLIFDMEDQKVSDEEQPDQENIHDALRDGLTSFRDAFDITCRSTNQPHNQCGQCKACLVDTHVHEAKEWWLQTGDLMKRRFLLALINRLKRDILDHVAQILKPFVNAKGFFCYF